MDQIAEQNKEEDRAQKVRVEQVALALKEKFVYVQESEREVEGKTDMQGWAREVGVGLQHVMNRWTTMGVPVLVFQFQFQFSSHTGVQ